MEKFSYPHYLLTRFFLLRIISLFLINFFLIKMVIFYKSLFFFFFLFNSTDLSKPDGLCRLNSYDSCGPYDFNFIGLDFELNIYKYRCNVINNFFLNVKIALIAMIIIIASIYSIADHINDILSKIDFYSYIYNEDAGEKNIYICTDIPADIDHNDVNICTGTDTDNNTEKCHAPEAEDKSYGGIFGFFNVMLDCMGIRTRRGKYIFFGTFIFLILCDEDLEALQELAQVIIFINSCWDSFFGR